ncbi:MAG: transposase [Anaerolineaceae bacterium]|nr:transposase [Anaerolineaceae bacterium]
MIKKKLYFNSTNKPIEIVYWLTNLFKTVVPNLQSKTVEPHIENQIGKNANVYSDEFCPYGILPRMVYDHQCVLHGQGIFVVGNVYTNTIEGF